VVYCPLILFCVISTSTNHQIVACCSVTIGILNYYLCYENLSKVRSIVNYHLRWLAVYTLAQKHKSSSHRISPKFSKNLVKTNKGTRLAALLDLREREII